MRNYVRIATLYATYIPTAVLRIIGQCSVCRWSYGLIPVLRQRRIFDNFALENIGEFAFAHTQVGKCAGLVAAVRRDHTQ